VNESAVEPAYGGETSSTLCGQTREPSARQLPTNHDHEGGESRSSNISMINRRKNCPPRPLTRSLRSFKRKTTATKESEGEPNPRLELDGSFHINVPAFSYECQSEAEDRPAALVSCNALKRLVGSCEEGVVPGIAQAASAGSRPEATPMTFRGAVIKMCRKGRVRLVWHRR
jgi:hypothetical protein